MQKSIQLTNVSYRYKNKDILKNVNITIDKRVNMIIGSSGSGKTTLLNVMSGIQSPTEGSVYRSSDKIGCLFQQHFLIYELTVAENLALVMNIQNIYNSKHISYVLKELNMIDKMHYYPDDLSVGEQQRVALARVLVASPDIVFADEPTSSIDPKNSDKIMSILLNLSATVVITTHNYSWIDHADEIIDMSSFNNVLTPHNSLK